jgi:hypothetical protein
MIKTICILALIAGFSSAVVAQDSEMTIQALNGKNGKPLVHRRLLVFGGKTAEAASHQETIFDVTTDGNGFARVVFDPAKTRWIEVFADFLTLCHNKPNLVQFSVDTILSTGFASPNHCGKIVPLVKPGQFTVFARPATLREKMAW